MDNSRAMAASLIGAVIGSVAAYLFFTEHGRTLRRQIEPALDDLSRELNGFRSTVQKAMGMASDGWKVLNEAMGDREGQPQPSAGARPSSPF